MKHTPLDAAVDALAVARLTHLLQEDDVYPILEVRSAFLDKAGESRIGDLARCGWCLSMWLGPLVLLARHRFPRAWPLVARVLAFSYITGKLESL